MKKRTSAQIARLAANIKATAADYPAEVRYEVLDELLAVTIRDEDLSSADAGRLRDAVA